MEVDGSDPPFLLPGAGAGVLRDSHLRNTPWGGALPSIISPLQEGGQDDERLHATAASSNCILPVVASISAGIP